MRGLVEEWHQQFAYDIVSEDQLDQDERKIFNCKDEILSWFPEESRVVKKVLISNTIRPNSFIGSDTTGVWDSSKKQIIIKRSQLKDIKSFASALIRELACANIDPADHTITFESKLTQMMGVLAVRLLESDEIKKFVEKLKGFLNRKA